MRMTGGKQVMLHLCVLVLIAIVLFPSVLLVFNALKTETEIFNHPLGVPRSPTLQNLRSVALDTTFVVNLRNSAIVGLCTVLIVVIVTAPAGYALSRFKFRGRTLFSTLLLATQAFPGIIMALGLLTVLITYGLVNRLPGLIIMHAGFSMPFSIWLLKGYFDEIPVALEESSWIDGCTRLQSLTRIVLPLAVPGLLGVATFTLLLSWGEFFFALVVMRSPEMYTLPVFLAHFVGSGGIVEWGPLSTAGLLTALPPVILFVFGQRYLISGLTRGALK